MGTIAIIIITVLVIIVLILFFTLRDTSEELKNRLDIRYLKDKQIEDLKKEKQELQKYLDIHNSDKENNKISISSLRQIIYLFIKSNSSLIVYTNSNFYKNFRFHNKRYYAKINNKTTHNTAEAIPFLEIDGKSNLVLDLYKLSALLSKKSSYNNTDLLEYINSSYINKEDVISNLGNKSLKHYER